MKVICSRFDRCPEMKNCSHGKIHDSGMGCTYHAQCRMSKVSTECIGPQLLDTEQQVKLTLREL